LIPLPNDKVVCHCAYIADVALIHEFLPPLIDEILPERVYIDTISNNFIG
jgi:hypothetical protein